MIYGKRLEKQLGLEMLQLYTYVMTALAKAKMDKCSLVITCREEDSTCMYETGYASVSNI